MPIIRGVAYPEPEVGMKVLVVYSRRNKPEQYEMTITKIGRKWIELGQGYGNERFDKLTWALDGGTHTSPGRVYPNAEVYEAEVALKNLWGVFRDRVQRNHTVPSHLAIESIERMLAILRGSDVRRDT